ncbi:MAG TPA: hypothetical protein VKX29_06930, partial [Brumimicrobium sp.]|nr:hypothetical protein [Brumimicrobium sp.]
MKRWNFIILILFFIPFISLTQEEWVCGTDEAEFVNPKALNCTKSSDIYNELFKHKESYIPIGGSNEDFIKTLHVSFHIWQRGDGSGNLDDTQATKNRLIQVIDWANQNYSSVHQNNNPPPYTTEYIEDSRVRIVLDSIYFYKDITIDSVYSYVVSGPGNRGHNTVLDNFIKNNYPNRLNALPLHIVRGHDTGGAAGWSHNGSVLSFYRTNPDWNTNSVHDYWYSQHLVHEIGHGLDLAHTYDNSNAQNCNVNNFDFLWDVYDTTATRPCPTVPYCDVCPITKATQNNIIMGGYSPRFISALQMGIIHRSTRIENQWNLGYDVRRYFTGYNETALEISENQTWDFSLKMYQDIIVKSGTTLTIKCKVLFVPEAKVIIEQGAKLILDGGILTNEQYYNILWQGIQVYGTTDKNQFPEHNPMHQGLLVVKNGGIIENAHKAVTNWHQDKWNEIGGVIQVTDGVFRNNRRDVEFMSYQNYTPNYSN